MQLDTRIPLMAQGPQIESPVNALFNATRLRSAQAQMGEQERQTGERNALAAVLRQPDTFGTDGRFNRAALPAIAQAAPGAVPQYAGLANQQDANQDQASVRQIQLAKQGMELQGRLLQGVRDEPSYQAAKQAAAQAGIDVSQLPPNYDPAFVQQALARNMSQMEQFDMLYKQETLNLARRKQDLEERAPRGQVLDTANGPMIVDPRTGEGRPVMSGGAAVPPKDKGMNEGQAKANLFGSRMQEADKIIAQMAEGGVNRPGTIKSIAESIPVVGGALGSVVNADPTGIIRPSAQQQQVEQAQRDFINAVLRRESGAAIAESEFDSARKQYFPAVGDSPEVIAQKAANRERATQLMLAEVPAAARERSTAALGGGSPAAAPPAGGVLSPAQPAARTIARTGTLNGRKVVQYSDGSTEYAD
ncbi:hypothetical protein D3C87_518700 [compost metagenome]